MDCIIASTSTVYGSGYLEYIKPELKTFFKETSSLIFIPFARPGGISHEQYTAKVQDALGDLFENIQGLHEFNKPQEALSKAEAVFTGGGNTFLLVKQLHEQGLMKPLASAVQNGVKYLGTSAGSNICGLSMHTTNDMPIVHPPSFKTLGLFNFNINPHYLDPDPQSTHKGETRETRLNEFHHQHHYPVIGLREGSYLRLKDHKITLKGQLTARVFEANKAAYELEPETEIIF